MVDGHLFEKISAIAARLRKKTDKPFGGIQVSPILVSSSVNPHCGVQLVVTGDFFQLPPVTKGGQQPFFAFECDAWKACIEHTVTLTQVFRQKDDSTYLQPALGQRAGTERP
jgi:ATP-dependent DNA helicase PIF1